MAPTPSELIDKQIAGLPDWRGGLLSELRDVINGADPDLAEEWKWDTAVWTVHGNVCAVGTFQDHVKINFFKGASLPDPQGLFNSGLEAKASRAIDLVEGTPVNKPALQDLVRAAIALNGAKK